MDILKWLARQLPVDENDSAGFGPFRLPESASWMESVFKYHDYYYRIGPELDMKLSDIDWRVFKALVIKAETEPNLIKRCRRVRQICRYWPIMRTFGHYMYGRHRNVQKKS